MPWWLFVINLLVIVPRVWGGSEAWERRSERFTFAYYYRGRPYPMFRQEIMEKGQPNKELRRFCRFFLRRCFMKRAANSTDRVNKSSAVDI